MRHLLLRACVVSTAAAVLAACGSGGTQEQSAGGNSTDSFKGRGPITLAGGKDNTGVLAKMLDKWNKSHRKEQVRFIELPDNADDQRQRMIQNAELKSGEFSVLSLDVVWTAEFAANRWVAELPKDRFEAGKYLGPTLEGASYLGRLYAAPWTSDGGLLYYRSDLLKQVGAQPPRTWAEMEQTCQKVLALPQGRGMSCYAGQFDKYEGLTVNFSEMIDGAGGSVVDKDGKPTVDSPEALKGLSFFTDAYKSGLIPKKAITFKEEEGRQAFQQSRLVFHRQWPYQWSLANAKDGSSKVAGKFGVAPLPGLNGPGVSSLGGHNLAVSRFAENKATALDFITFITSEQSQRENLLLSSNAPTIASLYDDPAMIEKYPYLPVLKSSILSAAPRPRVVRYGDATAAIQGAAYQALQGGTPPAAALKELQERLEKIARP
ncbi:ABC transporter substrate-binding protein [Streptomyces sp. NBC_00885]|uniref:ABC transporter substrate-binding protein n=1 Tax=Streptomyces sp. NBC_00885 TaxID=2975857 RepID=UPI00386E6C4D|nr:ABC transporter substrate-binding protein [Streptomyces sp. NBC_00885]